MAHYGVDEIDVDVPGIELARKRYAVTVDGWDGKLVYGPADVSVVLEYLIDAHTLDVRPVAIGNVAHIFAHYELIMVSEEVTLVNQASTAISVVLDI